MLVGPIFFYPHLRESDVLILHDDLLSLPICYQEGPSMPSKIIEIPEEELEELIMKINRYEMDIEEMKAMEV